MDAIKTLDQPSLAELGITPTPGMHYTIIRVRHPVMNKEVGLAVRLNRLTGDTAWVTPIEALKPRLNRRGMPVAGPRWEMATGLNCLGLTQTA